MLEAGVMTHVLSGDRSNVPDLLEELGKLLVLAWQGFHGDD